MGKLSDRVRSMISRQVKNRGIVVWYDPEKAYTGLVQNLNLPETTVLGPRHKINKQPGEFSRWTILIQKNMITMDLITRRILWMIMNRLTNPKHLRK